MKILRCKKGWWGKEWKGKRKWVESSLIGCQMCFPSRGLAQADRGVFKNCLCLVCFPKPSPRPPWGQRVDRSPGCVCGFYMMNFRAAGKLLPCVEHSGILLQEFQETTLRKVFSREDGWSESWDAQFRASTWETPPDASIRDKTFEHLQWSCCAGARSF